MKLISWVVLVFLALTMPVHAASFDCEKASSKVEKLICNSPEISKLDDGLAKTYQETLLKVNEEKKKRLVIEQRNWLKQSRNNCSDEACVKQAYTSRLEALAVFLISKTLVQFGDWIYRDGGGKNESLCHELLKRLNRYDRDEGLENRCSFPVIASYPQFTAPPWEELDLGKNEELLFKLMKYGGEGGPDGYFHLLPELKQRSPDSAYRYKAKRFVEEGGRLRVWRTRLVNQYGTGPIVSAPPGEQTIVQMIFSVPKVNQDAYCVGKPKPTSVYGAALLYIVTSDLSGPDPNVDPGTYGILGGHDLVIYEGKPLLVGSESIWQDGELRLSQLCDFEFITGK